MSAGVVLVVVTSTGLRSTGGSLSQRLGSVHSWLTILSWVGATRSGVTAGSGDAFRTNLLLVALGASASVDTDLYGVDVLSIASSTHNSFLATATMARLLPHRFLSREKKAAHFGLVLTSPQADSTRAHRNSPEPCLVMCRSLDLLPPVCRTTGTRPA